MRLWTGESTGKCRSWIKTYLRHLVLLYYSRMCTFSGGDPPDAGTDSSVNLRLEAATLANSTDLLNLMFDGPGEATALGSPPKRTGRLREH